MIYGTDQLRGPQDFPSLWRLGLGSVDIQTLIQWNVPSQGNAAIIGNVLIANLAQPILSIIYFVYNGILTCMLAGLEWSQYAWQKKGLRVSVIPQGSQRSSYFLQLPYRYGIAVVVVSGLLHWLVSQSLFLVAVVRSKPLGSETSLETLCDGSCERIRLTCGWSPMAVLFVILLGCLMIISVLILSQRRYKRGIPLVVNKSTAIAACCQLAEGDGSESLSHQPVMWGVVRLPQDDIAGHCSFSYNDVESPIEGQMYSGL